MTHDVLVGFSALGGWVLFCMWLAGDLGKPIRSFLKYINTP